MKTISAVSEKIETIFSDKYLIPMYQRKYTWEEDKCHRLWDDLLEFHDNTWKKKKSEKYFLGTMTVWGMQDDVPWEVIDGQQRLITLSLLIKALLILDDGNKKLLKCLHVENPANDEVSTDNELRVTTESVEENNKNFIDIIRSNDDVKEYDTKSQMGKNYALLQGEVLKWANYSGRRKNDTQVKLMIIMITDNVEILRIKSESMDDALNIFETINDRGKPLDDSDILKVQLYKNVPNKSSNRKDFNDRWNDLQDPKDIFTIYMHILKAKKGDADTTTQSPRKFFHDYNKKCNLFNKWEEVMLDLEKIRDITMGNWNIPSDIMNWWEILNTAYPGRGNRTSHWRLPLYVYLFEHIHKRSNNGMLSVTKKVQDEFEKLMIVTVKFLVIKGLNYKNSSVVRSPAYKMYTAIAGKHKESKYNKGKYLNVYRDDLKDNRDFHKFETSIGDHNEFKSYLRLLVYLASYLSRGQSKDANTFAERLRGKVEVEHILPKSWEKYSKWGKIAGWTSETHAEDLWSIGNLMLLEQDLNKRASNQAFGHKKAIYKDSKFKDAISLSKSKGDDWKPSLLALRNQEVCNRIVNFVKTI